MGQKLISCHVAIQRAFSISKELCTPNKNSQNCNYSFNKLNMATAVKKERKKAGLVISFDSFSCPSKTILI